jgi:hypothetical protein
MQRFGSGFRVPFPPGNRHGPSLEGLGPSANLNKASHGLRKISILSIAASTIMVLRCSPGFSRYFVAGMYRRRTAMRVLGGSDGKAWQW